MKRILVPIDFSDYSESVCNTAMILAAGLRGEIKLMHVYQDEIIDSGLPIDSGWAKNLTKPVLDSKAAAAQQNLNKINIVLENRADKEKLHINFDASAIIKGNPAKEILNVAQSYKPDIIIMGTRGAGASHNWAGSVTQTVIRESRTPVLSIPKGSDLSKFKNLVFATNLERDDDSKIRWTLKFFAPFDVKLKLIHVAPVDSDLRTELATDRIEEVFEEEKKSGKLSVTSVVGDDVLESLKGHIDKRKTDLLILGTQHRNFLTRLLDPSLTEKFLKDGWYPILAMK